MEGAVPFLHGSQGCATYIRRYMISHFKEPLDIASSNFGEDHGHLRRQENLREGLENVVRQYAPQLIGIATTCLAETIGDDVAFYLRQIAAEAQRTVARVGSRFHAQLRGHAREGFHATVLALVEALAKAGPRHEAVNVLPGMVSPADLRYLKDALPRFRPGADPACPTTPTRWTGRPGPSTSGFRRAARRSRPSAAWAAPGRRSNSARPGTARSTAGALLEERFGVPRYDLPLPMGVTQTDRLFEVLERTQRTAHARRPTKRSAAGWSTPTSTPTSMCSASGPSSMASRTWSWAWPRCWPRSAWCRRFVRSGGEERPPARADRRRRARPGQRNHGARRSDFAEIEDHAAGNASDLVIGNSKGYGLARKLQMPLVRVGFPIHDRVDGPRLLHLGYRGAQQLFDRIANALIAAAQDASPVGYSYM